MVRVHGQELLVDLVANPGATRLVRPQPCSLFYPRARFAMSFLPLSAQTCLAPPKPMSSSLDRRQASCMRRLQSIVSWGI